MTEKDFQQKINTGFFYEYAMYNDCFYGTGNNEWNTSELFIMETEGIRNIKPEDRKDSLIIYVNTPRYIRYKRMRQRGWDKEKIDERLAVDDKKFIGFVDYDFQISSKKNDN